MEYFNSVLVAYIPQMLKQERTPNNYTWFNNFRYDRAEQIMATGGLHGAYQQVIPYATGPMSCAKHRWAIRRLNKFSSSCWGKTCIRQYFFYLVFFMHNILKPCSHTVLPRTRSSLFLKSIMGQNFWMQEVHFKAVIITVDGIFPQTPIVVGVDLKDTIFIFFLCNKSPLISKVG